MADPQQQQQQQKQSAGGPATAKTPTPLATHPAATMVENMMSRGEHDPRPIANILSAHPDAQTEILAILHATIGNAFVAQVAAAVHAIATEEKPKAADVPAGPVRVTAGALNVRSAPSSANNHNVVGRLHRGTIVTPQGKDGDWLRIEHNGEPAFIHGDYVVSVVAPPKHHVEKHGGDEDGGAHDAAPVSAPPPPAPPAPPPLPSLPIARADSPAPSLPIVHADSPAPTPAPIAPTPTPIAPPKTTDPKDTAPTTPTPVNAAGPDKPTPSQQPPADLHGTYKGVFSKVYNTGAQKSQVWVSEGGVSATPNIYVHFHGYRTDYGIDHDLEWEESPELKLNQKTQKYYQPAPKEHRSMVDVGGSGHRAAKEAMAAATNKNTVVILPQGTLGEGGGGAHEGGFMRDIEKLGLAGFLDKILKQLAVDIGVQALSPGHIGLGGHSAGGYEGTHQAMKRLGKGQKDEALMDQITDLTLYDASYSSAHLSDAQQWMVHGEGGKNLRLVNSKWQHEGGGKEEKTWQSHLGPAALKKLAGKSFTLHEVGDAGAKLDNETSVMQHTQLIRKDNGKVQCDVLVLMYHQKKGSDHEPLRDRTIDDAIMSIGEGAAGNATFGRHDKGKLIEEHAELKREEAHGDNHDVLALPTAHADTAPAPDKQIHPQPEHVDGEQKGDPETVKPPPASNAIPPALDKARKKHKKQAELFDKLYNDKTGDARLGNIGRHSTTKVKGKKVEIDLTDEQYAFKQKVFVKAIERVGDGLFGGVPKDKLDPIPGTDQTIRKEVKSDLMAMIAAAKSELGVELTVASGYRDIKVEMGLWNKAFDTIYLWMTKAYREKHWPDDPYGDAAAEYTANEIAPRKAVPGSSNHSNGIAVDLTGKGLNINYKDQEAWRSSRVYQWLNGKGEFKDKGAASKRFKFENYHKEAWHYDWRGKLDE